MVFDTVTGQKIFPPYHELVADYGIAKEPTHHVQALSIKKNVQKKVLFIF